MNDERKIIWSDLSATHDNEWFDELKEEYPDLSDREIFGIMNEADYDNLSTAQCELSIQLPREIIIIGDLGLWDGRKSGYKMIDSGNIRDCLYSDCDRNEWYVDKNGDLRCEASHHDGTNRYLYRAIKENATDAQVDRLKEKIYNRQATRADITRVTERLGDKIGEVYGWSFPQTNKSKAQVR